MKKMVIVFVMAVLLVGGIFLMNFSKDDGKGNDKVSDDVRDKSSLVLYFSATGTTKKVAEMVKEASGGDILEIVPMEAYTSDDLNYNVDDTRANREQKDETARPKIKNEIDVSNYDVIYLGFPIWWGDVPKIVLTLMESVDFQGKTIVPFCTSGGSGIEMSVQTLKKYDGVKFLTGRRFSSNSSLEEIKKWLEEVNG